MRLRITVEGKVYDVEVEVVGQEPAAGPAERPPEPAPGPPVPTSPPPARSQAPAPVVAHDASRCVSPLPGTVLKVLVKPGDTVTANQTLMVLDAMKMETNVPSAVAGRVKAVHVEAGATVRQGDLLVEFE